jgi:hypothetical protein
MRKKLFHLKDHRLQLVDFRFVNLVVYEKLYFLRLSKCGTISTFSKDEYEMEDIANPYHSIRHFRARDAKFY